MVVMALGLALAASGALAAGPAPALAASATPTVLASDSFSRTVTDAWGKPDSGGTYSLFGTRADYDVAAGVGSMRLQTANTTRRALLGTVAARDVDLTARVKFDRRPVVGGGGQYAYLVARHQAGGAEYQARVRFGPDGNVYIGAGRTVNGPVPGATPLRPEVRVPALAATANTWFRLRVEMVGSNPSTLRMRAWRDGTAEPTAWPFVATDSSEAVQLAGSVGLMAYGLPAGRECAGHLSFDDLRVVDATPSLAGDWPQFHRDQLHQGENATEAILSPSNVKGLRLAWTGLTGTMWSSPVVANGVVYAGSWDGKLYAFPVGCGSAGASCAPLWTGATGDPIEFSSPAVANGVVYIGSRDHKLYAFAVGCGSGGASCSPLWTGTTGDMIMSSPTVADGVVYVGSMDGKLYAFAVGCGSGGAACSPLWTGATGAAIDRSSPAVADGVVYVGSMDQQAVCLCGWLRQRRSDLFAAVDRRRPGTGSCPRPRWLTAWCTSRPTTTSCMPSRSAAEAGERRASRSGRASPETTSTHRRPSPTASSTSARMTPSCMPSRSAAGAGEQPARRSGRVPPVR